MACHIFLSAFSCYRNLVWEVVPSVHIMFKISRICLSLLSTWQLSCALKLVQDQKKIEKMKSNDLAIHWKIPERCNVVLETVKMVHSQLCSVTQQNSKWCLESSFSSLTENSKCSKKLVHYITCITLPEIVDHQVCQPLIFISLLAGSVRPNNILSYTVGHQSTWHSENL